MQLPWLSELIRKEGTSQRTAEEIRMTLLRNKTQKTTNNNKNPTKPAKPTTKIKLKVLPENTGCLGRHEKDMKREIVISET